MARGLVSRLLPVALGLAFCAATAGIVRAPGDLAPQLRSLDLGGKFVSVNWTENQATLVNFWAAWCQPCRNEMPALEELYERRKKDGLVVVGVHVNGNDKDEDVERFLHDLGITYPVIRGTAKIKNAWGGAGTLPTSYLVDKDGIIVRRYVGAAPAQTRGLVDDVEALLDGRPMKSQVVPGLGP